MTISNAQYIDFQPVRVVYNKYLCEDKVVIRNKLMIVAVLRMVDNEGRTGYSFSLSSRTEVDVLPKDLGKIGNPTEQVNVKVPDDLDRETKFEILDNKPQVYETSDSSLFIFVRERMEHIWRTKLTDSIGRPVYYVEVKGEVATFSLGTIPP